MFLLRSAGTRLSLLLEENRHALEAHSSQNRNSDRRRYDAPKCDQSDNDSHTRKCTQLPLRPTNRRVPTDGGSMGEVDDRRGFFPSLSRTAFTRAVFQSNVFLPKLNAMRIPVSFHTALKTAELSVFLDSGATECFVSQRFIDKHKLGTRLLTIPQKLQNADRSPNAGGGLTHFTELEVFTGDDPHKLQFYIADMGPDDLVLGYPWFAATNVQPNWTEGTLPTSVTICTRGAVLRPSTRRSRYRISVSRAFAEDRGTQRSSLLSCLSRAEPRRLAWL